MSAPELAAKPMPVSCFAPPLTDELLAGYAARIDALPDSQGALRDVMRTCLAAVRLWWELPESPADPEEPKLAVLHRGRDVRVPLTKLTPDIQKALFDAIPWAHELKAMKELVDGLDQSTPEGHVLKAVASHLLWHVCEFERDREPLTLDRLPE